MCWCLVLLCCVSTNCTQLLGRVDQVLQEDSEYLLREQGGFRNQGEYAYDGWRKMFIVFELLLNLVFMLWYNISMQSMSILLEDQCME